MLRTCSANKEWTKVHALWPVGQVRAVCVQREPTGRVITVIVTEREKEREKEEKEKENEGRERRKRERRRRGEKKRRDERERDKRPPPLPLPQNVSVCRFKTLPCVPAKRAHVFNMRTFCRHTRKRFEPTHGDILNLHTGFFRVPSRATHATHTTTHHTPQTQLNTQAKTTHNDTAQHTTTSKHKTPTPHTLSAHTPHTLSTHHTTRHITPHMSHTTHTKHTHHIAHTPHTRMLGYAHNRQPTVILRRKSECLDMRTAVNRP